MQPLVSIAIPTFDRPHYLKEAVASAEAQTYSNLEILIGDNGTMEETRELGLEAAHRDGRIKYRRNERNLGMSANFNALADAARGEFLVLIGDDDRLLPEFVSRLVGVMEPGIRAAFSNHYLIDTTGRLLKAESKAYTQQYGRDILSAGVIADPEAAAWRQSIALSAALLRTADMQRLRFREDLNTPDAEFFIRLAQKGAPFAFVPDYLAEYRVHGGAVTAAGLWSEQLVASLTTLEVRPEVEPYKRQFLTPMVVNAVSRCLHQGNMEMARRFLRSEYYPRRGHDRGLASGRGMIAASVAGQQKHDRFGQAVRYAVGYFLQSFCANLPASLGSSIYRAVQRVSCASFSARQGAEARTGC